MRARLRIQPGEPIAWTERVGWALASRAFPGKADRWVAAVRFPACTPLETPHRRMIWWKVSLFLKAVWLHQGRNKIVRLLFVVNDGPIFSLHATASDSEADILLSKLPTTPVKVRTGMFSRAKTGGSIHWSRRPDLTGQRRQSRCMTDHAVTPLYVRQPLDYSAAAARYISALPYVPLT